MNIIEMEDMVKGLPDQVLFQEAQMPSGRIPQFLALSEVQRRQDMRQRFSARQEQQGTVKDQILQGIGGIGPSQMEPQMAPPMAPPMAPQMGPQMAPPMQPPVQGMYAGGVVKMADGGSTEDEEFQRQFLFDKLLGPVVGPALFFDQSLRRNSLLEAASRPLERAIISYPGSALPSRKAKSVPAAEATAPQSPSGSREPTILPGTYRPPSALLGDQISFDRAVTPPVAAPAAPERGIASVGSVPDLTSGLMSRQEYLDMVKLDEKALEEAYAPVNYGDIIGRLGETAKRYSTEAEESIGKMREQAKKDAFAYALMQMGAGLAGGDMARGLERGAEAAFGVLDKSKQQEMDERRAARAEARALEAQGLQLEITGRGLDAQAKRDRFNAMRQSQVDMANAFRQFGMDEVDARYKAASLAQQAAATAATLQREGRLDKRSAVDLFQTILTNAMKDPPLESKMNQASMDAYRQKIYGEAAKIVQRSFPEFDFKDLVDATNQPSSSFLSPGIRSQLESLRGK